MGSNPASPTIIVGNSDQEFFQILHWGEKGVEMISAGQILSIELALKNTKHLRIPEYQRNYNWERENVEDFWSDLLEIITTGQDHFFGSLILENSHGDDGPLDVVDGQQRITTFLVLIARLRDELMRTDPTGQIKVNEQSFSLLDILNRYLGQHPESLTYRPNSLILETFEEICRPPNYSYGENKQRIKDDYEGRSIRKNSSEPDAAATLALRNTYFKLKQLVQERLNSTTDGLEGEMRNDARVEEIYRISAAAQQKLKVLPIQTGTQQESLEVFLTTNDRGLDLGVMDLVRGQILEVELKSASSAQQRNELLERHSDSLQTITRNVGTTNQIDAFLRHWLHLRPETVSIDKDGESLYQRLTMRKVPDFTKSIVSSQEPGAATRAKDLWKFIQKGAKIYPLINDPKDANSGSNQTRLQLMALKSIATSYKIFALRLFDEELGLSAKDRAKLVDALMKCVFKWILTGGNAQDLEIFLHKQSHRLKDANDVSHVLENFRHEVSVMSLTDEHLEGAASDSWNRGILFALEAESVGSGGIIDSYHVEHIAPQTSTKSWIDELGTRDAKEYKSWISDLGNLTLLDGVINEEIQQADFFVKKKHFAESNSSMAKMISKEFDKKWTTAEIAERSKMLREDLKRLLT